MKNVYHWQWQIWCLKISAEEADDDDDYDDDYDDDDANGFTHTWRFVSWLIDHPQWRNAAAVIHLAEKTQK